MSKPVLLAICPCQSQSGYGKHSSDLVRSIIKMDKFDVKVLPLRWGNTPLNALEPGKDDDIISRILLNPNLTKQPDITFQVTVPNEFQPIGKYNIGVTAGVETTVSPAHCIEGLNRMDLNIVTSNFAKHTFQTTNYTKNNPQTNQPMGQLKSEKSMEVLFEGCDTSVYRRLLENEEYCPEIKEELSKVKEDWSFLVVGHWLQGVMGHDRKDIGMTVKIFLETFKNVNNPPALILKISTATFSILDKNEMLKRLREIKSSVQSDKPLPNVYLLHGQLDDTEMNQLYNHPKIKAMVSFTKGEGFGRPLLEFTMSGKPIIASGWSGHLDFLDRDLSVLLPGKLEPVHPASVNDYIIKEGQWFTVDYNIGGNVMLDMFSNYNKYLSNAKKLMYQNKNSFTLNDMKNKLELILNKHLPEFPEELNLKLPDSVLAKKKIQLPKLKKIGGNNEKID